MCGSGQGRRINRSATMKRLITAILLTVACAAPAVAQGTLFHRADGRGLSPGRVDAEVEALMARARVPGLALALIEDGQVVYRRTYGVRDLSTGAPLERDTVMYGASLTKGAFAYMCMQLVDEGRLDLDRPIAEYLPKPLPDYEDYADLAADPRWRKFTPRMLLSHTSGMPNFRWLNANEKLDIKFEPGSRYVYSGEGINLMQLVLEEGLRLDVGAEMQRRVFDRFGMTRTSMTWRDDFAGNNASGHDEEGKSVGHNARRNVRAAGSMDTTLDDFSRFLAGMARGDGLSRRARRELVGEQILIAQARQFPSDDPTNAVGDANSRIGLAYGLGWGRWRSPYGTAWFKEGNGSGATNYAICLERGRRCMLVMTNSARGQRLFCALTTALLGPVNMPCDWNGYPREPEAPPT
jgi:CubicO group peptidase (beta-lactamase class C family)